MTSASDSTLNRIAAAGLLAGAGFGLGGTLVTSPDLQGSLWAIDGVALVIATSLLTLKYSRAGSEIVSAGFLVFAIGEGEAAARSGGTARWHVAMRRSAATGDRCRMSGVQVSRWLGALKQEGAP